MKLDIMNQSLNDWEPFDIMPFNLMDDGTDTVEVLITNDEDNFIYNIHLVTIAPTDTSISIYEYINNAWSKTHNGLSGSIDASIDAVIPVGGTYKIKLEVISAGNDIDVLSTNIDFKYDVSITDTTDLQLFLDFNNYTYSYRKGAQVVSLIGTYSSNLLNDNSYISISNSDEGALVSNMPVMTSLGLFIKGYFTSPASKTLFESGNLKIAFTATSELEITIGSYVWTSSDFIRSYSTEYILGIHISDTGTILCTLNSVIMQGVGVGTLTPILTTSSVYLFNDKTVHTSACIGDFDYVSIYSSDIKLSNDNIHYRKLN